MSKHEQAEAVRSTLRNLCPAGSTIHFIQTRRTPSQTLYFRFLVPIVANPTTGALDIIDISNYIPLVLRDAGDKRVQWDDRGGNAVTHWNTGQDVISWLSQHLYGDHLALKPHSLM